MQVVGLEQQNRVRKIYQNTNSVSKAGLTTSFTSTEDWKFQSMVTEDITIFHFEEHDTIFIHKWVDPLLSLYGISINGGQENKIDIANGTVINKFITTKFVTKYHRYPMTIFTGLQMIGGLIAVLNIAFLLRWKHHWEYEK